MFFSNKVAVAEEIATPDQISGRFVANPAPPGFNINGSSVATNFLDAYNKKQFFIKTAHSSVLFETPSSDVGHAGSIWWCGDLSFSNFFDNSVPMGFVGRCVYMFYDGKTQLVDQGVPGLIDDGIFDASMGITCVYVDQTNTFDCVSKQILTMLFFASWMMGVQRHNSFYGRHTMQVKIRLLSLAQLLLRLFGSNRKKCHKCSK